MTITPGAETAPPADCMATPAAYSRRDILSLSLGMAAGLGLPGTLRAQHDHAGAHSASLPASQHVPPPDVPYTGSLRLAPVDALPVGQPLSPLTVLSNQSRQAGVFRARLIAEPATQQWIDGNPTTAWCYNGITPGPLVDVYEGDIVEITYENRLPQPSTVHWHGLEIPVDQDGGPMDPVLPGQSRLYRYQIPMGNAGTHWFHPHPHYLTAEQVFRGLAGAIIVRDRNDPLRHLPEQHLFISDLRLADDGNIPPNHRMDWMNGREGQFVLVNGQHQPVIEIDGTQRWRIWNACSARYLNLSLGGVQFTLVGTDGGLLGAPIHGLKDIVLAPAERIEIVVPAADKDMQVALTAEPYERGMMGRMNRNQSARILASLAFRGGGSTHAIPEILRPILPLGEPIGRHHVSFEDRIDMEVLHASPGGMYARPQGLYFLVNGKSYDMHRVDLVGKVGQVEEWVVENASSMGMHHPFHVHGGHFQVVDRTRDGLKTAEPFLAWRDTVSIRAGESVRLRMIQSLPGMRMFHCHILEHEDLGMMGNLLVEST